LSALQATGLSVGYPDGERTRLVVSDVSLRLEPGRILGLAGESGAGKSTLALALAGFVPDAAVLAGGELRLGDVELTRMPADRLRRLWGAEISHLPQDCSTALNPALRVGGQIAELLKTHRCGRRPVDLLARVGLPAATLRRRPHELSGGEQQRVALAIATACDPSVLLLDEPTTGLDARTQARVIELIEALTRELEIATLLVSHDLPLLAAFCDELAVMYAGEIVERGPAPDVYRDPRHPYTTALLDAVPTIAGEAQLRGLSGAAPIETPGYRCGFAERCALVAPECLDRIELRPLGNGREARCTRDAVPGRSMVSAVPPERRETTGAILAASALTCWYGRAPAIEDLSFSLAPGASLGVAGESGSGKTTLLRTLAGLVRPRAGEMSLSGRPLAPGLKGRSRGELQAIQIVFQNPDSTLNPSHSVETALGRPLHLFRSDVAPGGRRAAAAEMLERVELSPRLLDRRPGELSAGQRQRVAIARALLARPDVLLCDEITSALDVSAQAAVLELLVGLRKGDGLALVVVSHDLGLLRHVADDLIVLEAGQVREQGQALEVLRAPAHPYTRALVAALPDPNVRDG
jgi:peptide/nickel transport system ATP-binding protein